MTSYLASHSPTPDVARGWRSSLALMEEALPLPILLCPFVVPSLTPVG